MSYQIERLKAEDYDELFDMLNTVFHKPKDAAFDVELPVMWKRDDEHMAKHIAIWDRGRIAAVVGIYMLPAVICGERVNFGTIGNVATRPEYEGRGMMKALMDQALQEAKAMGMDIARLCGKRQRYNRYGFERAGEDYQFKLWPKNLMDYYGGKKVDGEVVYGGSELSGGAGFSKRFCFKRVMPEDTELLDEVMALEKNALLYVDRGDREQFFKTLSAYQNQIWAAIENGKTVGYVCVSPDGANISEHRGDCPENEYQMILEWLLAAEVNELTIHTAPWECALNARLGQICEKWSVVDPSMFHPFSWSKVLNALLQIKAKYTRIPEGSLVLHIQDYGTVEFSGQCCVDTDKVPQITLSQLDAIRFLLGNIPGTVGSFLPEELDDQTRLYIQNVFPLPLWWCNQDRV